MGSRFIVCNSVVCISVQQFDFHKIIGVDVRKIQVLKNVLLKKKTLLGVKLRCFHNLGMFCVFGATVPSGPGPPHSRFLSCKAFK